MSNIGRTYSIREIWSAWLQVGGARHDPAVWMTAIAKAESGGYDHAVSRSDDYGVWQINSIHASSFPRLWPQRFDILASARMAKAISGNGVNIGPWCTAWADPARNCGHYLTGPPQVGSAAGEWMLRTVLALGGKGPVNLQGTGAGVSADVHPGQGAWSRIQHMLGPDATDRHNRLTNARIHLRRL